MSFETLRNVDDSEDTECEPLPIAVLISGGGTTLLNLIRMVGCGELDVDIRLVVSSNPAAGGLEHARAAEIPTRIVERQTHESSELFRDAIFDPCRAANVRLVVMGGFLKHVLIPKDFSGRVINIHPSLIPDFCGKGFYGRRVHQAVVDAGVKVSGCTVHFVDDQFDHGPIILRTTVPVLPGDDADSLAKRVFAEECRALPAAIRTFTASPERCGPA